MTEIEVELVSFEREPTRGTVTLQRWDKRTRLTTSLQLWGVCWLLAIASIILPLLHFVLVPGFLLAGPAAAYWNYGKTEVILGGKGLCPNCMKPMEIVRSPVKWPINDLCAECHTRVRVAPVNLPIA